MKPYNKKTDNGQFLQTVAITSVGKQNPLIYQYMDTVGDGSGSNSTNVDGSVIPKRFYVKPKPGEVIYISRLILKIKDGGSFDSGGWGNNGGVELPNGVKFYIKRDTFEYNVFEEGIKSHCEIAGICHDLTHNNWGAGDEFVTARWTFTKAGSFIRLDGDNNDAIIFEVNDNLTYLRNQTVNAQGFYG